MTNSSLEYRRNKRYNVNEKVIALSFEDICRLTDISVDGAAIRCIGKSNLPSKWSLDILMAEASFHVTIPVKLVWEKSVRPSLYSTKFTKCVGVKFDNLTAENKLKVEYLIKLHDGLAV